MVHETFFRPEIEAEKVYPRRNKDGHGKHFFWHNHKFYRQIKGVGMGNKYAPSVANIFLNKWEEKEIFGKCWPHIKVYKRFIDDILIVWEGSWDKLNEFVQHIGVNQYGIKFTVNVHHETINILDLEIFKNRDRLYTRTHFKETNRNGYIPFSNCHHPQWKRAIPKAQFIRIKHNCDLMVDYQEQTGILIERFVDKGYERKELEHIRKQIGCLDRNGLLQGKDRSNTTKDKVPFITVFNSQYRTLERIVKKNWPIICNDPHLNKILPSKPTFIYRRAKRIRDMIVKNVPDPAKRMTTFFNHKGFYRCGKCKPCRLTNKIDRKIREFQSHAAKQEFKIDKLITCGSTRYLHTGVQLWTPVCG